MKIKTGNANVTKHVKKPAAYDGSHHTEQNIHNDTFPAVVYQVTRNKTSDQAKQDPNKE
jgi:hypothetical protein